MRRTAPAVTTLPSPLMLERTWAQSSGPEIVNDVHSRLNATRVRSVVAVRAIADGLLDYATGQIINVDGGFHLRSL